MKLYDSAASPFAARCRIQLRAKGLAYESILFGHPLPDSYRNINPIARIPALEVDGTVIPESTVIAEYLEDAYPDQALRPGDPLAAARMRLLMRIVDLYVMAPMERLFDQLMAETRDPGVVSGALSGIASGVRFIDRFLGDSAYAVGNRLTLADCTLAPALFYVETFCPMFGSAAPFAGATRVEAYRGAIAQDPHVAAVMAEVGEALSRALGR